MGKPLEILSLGAGVQSTTLLLMSCLGELPKLDAAIFADTQWEPKAVYTHLEWLTGFAREHGIPVHSVTAGDLRAHSMKATIRGRKADGETYASMPLRVLNNDGTKSGLIRRQCSREFKIDPIDRAIKTDLLRLGRRDRWPVGVAVRMWLGISSDEMRRVRVSRDRWKEHAYPFCGLPRMLKSYTHLTRAGCVEWLGEQFPDITVPRSACIGCPYQTNREWRDLKRNRPDEWANAVEVDEAIRHADKRGGRAFLHNSYKPLAEADLDSDVDKGQTLLFGDDGNECLGYCGN